VIVPCSLSPRTPPQQAPSSPTPMRFSTHPPPSRLKTSACYSPPAPLCSCARGQAPFKFKRRHVTCQRRILFTCLSMATTLAVFLNSARFFPSPTYLRAITRLSCRGDLLHLSPYAWRSIARHSLSCASPPPTLPTNAYASILTLLGIFHPMTTSRRRRPTPSPSMLVAPSSAHVIMTRHTTKNPCLPMPCTRPKPNPSYYSIESLLHLV
jgi:hypothetical protein